MQNSVSVSRLSCQKLFMTQDRFSQPTFDVRKVTWASDIDETHQWETTHQKKLGNCRRNNV